MNDTHLPKITEKEFKILDIILNGGEMFGLEIVESSNGEVKRGTVYVTLNRMIDKGFLESREEPRAEPEIGLPRRMFKVTGFGERVYRAYAAAQSQFKLILEGA